MQHLALHVCSAPYLPFVFVCFDFKNDVIEYLHKLKIFSNIFVKVNDNKLRKDVIIVDYV